MTVPGKADLTMRKDIQTKISLGNISVVNHDKCVGCAACSTACPISAIDMVDDDEGFIVPRVCEAKCVSCGKCVAACPLDNYEFHEMRQIYAVALRDMPIKLNSSSGGAFYWIASNVLERGGVVYGAAFDSAKKKVKHIRVVDIESLQRLQNSKYVQSSIGDSYARVKIDLTAGNVVLFSGTPCQIAGLYSSVGRHERLYTCDVLCYGVPSPLVLRSYLEEVAGDEFIDSINMRNKVNGWVGYSMRVDLRERSYCMGKGEDLYQLGFQSQLFYRRSCYACEFRRRERVGDLTLGDFWSFKESFKKGSIRNDDTGISYLSVNTNRGTELFEVLDRHKVDIERRPTEENGDNLGFGLDMEIPEHRESFFQDLKSEGYAKAIQPFVAPTKPRRASHVRMLYRRMKRSYHFRMLLHWLGIPV